jgi:hypothetical protein
LIKYHQSAGWSERGDKLPSSTFGPPYEASLAIVFGLLPYEDITTP